MARMPDRRVHDWQEANRQPQRQDRSAMLPDYHMFVHSVDDAERIAPAFARQHQDRRLAIATSLAFDASTIAGSKR